MASRPPSQAPSPALHPTPLVPGVPRPHATVHEPQPRVALAHAHSHPQMLQHSHTSDESAGAAAGPGTHSAPPSPPPPRTLLAHSAVRTETRGRVPLLCRAEHVALRSHHVAVRSTCPAA